MVYTYWYIPISYLYYKLLNFENQQSKIDVYKKDNLLKIFDCLNSIKEKITKGN